MTNKDPLVFSTDATLNKRCPKCKSLLAECTCAAADAVDTSTITAALRMEKVGRSGKEVTVIDRLPKSQPYLRKLAQDLKKDCGAGGTYRVNRLCGVIEIQGDKREEIRAHFATAGIACKG
jgi:translation initiation factor 1